MAQQTLAVAHRADSSARERGGCTTVAAVMLILASIVTTTDGIAAISPRGSPLRTCGMSSATSTRGPGGWFGLGVAQAVVTLGVLRRQSARLVGRRRDRRARCAQLVFVPAYPSWSLSVLAIDVLVTYGFAAHGGRAGLGPTGARSQWPG